MNFRLIAICGALAALLGAAPPVAAAPDAGREPLRILDATLLGVAALRQGAFAFALEHGTDVSVDRVAPAAAFEKLAAGEVDLVVSTDSAVPEAMRGWFRRFAVDALVGYVNVRNRARQVKTAEFRELVLEIAPTWEKLTGNPAQVHRYTLKRNAPGHGLAEAVFAKRQTSAAAVPLASTREAALLVSVDTEGFAVGRFLPEPPDGVVALAVDGVAPLIASVKSGSYPLRLVYGVTASAKPGATAAAFLEFMKGNRFNALLLDEGLYPSAGLR